MEVRATIGTKADAGKHLLDLANTIIRDNTNGTLPNSRRRRKKKLNKRWKIFEAILSSKFPLRDRVKLATEVRLSTKEKTVYEERNDKSHPQQSTRTELNSIQKKIYERRHSEDGLPWRHYVRTPEDKEKHKLFRANRQFRWKKYKNVVGVRKTVKNENMWNLKSQRPLQDSSMYSCNKITTTQIQISRQN